MTHHTLFRSGHINHKVAPNRLVVAPMTRISASETGVPGARMKAYYNRFARGGFGTIITEGIYIDDAWSQTYAFQSGLINQEQVHGWREITESLHRLGSLAIAQIQHSGALSQGNMYRSETVAPSAVRPRGEQLKFYYGEGSYPIPRELTDAEILDIIRNFAATAARAVSEAGFDGVEIHGANGYLLDQFLTDYTNQRTDRWGGDMTSRLSLILAVVSAVREAVGQDCIVGVRISQGKVNDFYHKWAEGVKDAETVFSRLAASSLDYIHLTEYEAWQPAFGDSPLTLVELARRYAPDLTIIANGSVDTAEKAEKVIALGADFVAIGKSALANPDWPARVREQKALREFDPAILSPRADVKDSELS
ncbi:NADH:flavin oxidoreductase [Enterobacter sp. Acro-832]|uniref:oxidoreductase n=1 Tax=Enterobacter sp. Acro-832 TaxID=2608348 RepID=UPI00142029F3|nr:NADH:flavin oxidoreductase [Enterobacter sp. Acro-832]NIG46434.1 NADH:flavin oxidoreductase [Enterobacter sp. Acro-832]